MTGTTALVVSQLTALPIPTANFDEVRERLDALLADFRDTKIEAKDYKDAKKWRAYLNSLDRSLDERRKDVKRHYLLPYESFEAETKKLAAMISEVSGPIDEQIKRIEEEMRAEKRAELEEYWYALIGIAGELVPFERIENPKWLNQSVSVKSAQTDIDAIAMKLSDDEAALSALDLPHAAEAKAELFATLDLSRAVAKSRALEAEAERLARFEAEKAELLAAQEAAKEAAAEPVCDLPCSVDPCDHVECTRDDEPEPVPAAPARLEGWAFEVACTLEQRDQIIRFIGSLGLTGTARRLS